MTNDEHDNQMVRWSRVHADACRVEDRELQRLVIRMMARHAGPFKKRETKD